MESPLPVLEGEPSDEGRDGSGSNDGSGDPNAHCDRSFFQFDAHEKAAEQPTGYWRPSYSALSIRQVSRRSKKSLRHPPEESKGRRGAKESRAGEVWIPARGNRGFR